MWPMCKGPLAYGKAAVTVVRAGVFTDRIDYPAAPMHAGEVREITRTSPAAMNGVAFAYLGEVFIRRRAWVPAVPIARTK